MLLFFYKKMETPIGEITLICDENFLKRILFQDEKDVILEKAELGDNNEILNKTYEELNEYFNGNLKEFKVKISPEGTAFQKQCWNVLVSIEYGKTICYEEEAIKLGDKNKVRAVGGANGKNPIPIIIPCHRVIGKDGKLTGYAGGIHIKQFLLEHEKKNASIA